MQYATHLGDKFSSLTTYTPELRSPKLLLRRVFEPCEDDSDGGRQEMTLAPMRLTRPMQLCVAGEFSQAYKSWGKFARIWATGYFRAFVVFAMLTQVCG